MLALQKATATDVFNVASGQIASIKDIAEALIDILESCVEPDITEQFRFGDNRHDFSDITKIKKAFGFNAKWKLKEGMQELVKWSESQSAIDKFEQAEAERRKFMGD
jgi:dTDP-L-rhamnose 4-epimerase